MLSKIELTKYILLHSGNKHHDAQDIIISAQKLSIDIFEYFIFRMGINEQIIYQFAAKYCALPFSEFVPQDLEVVTNNIRFDDLGSLDSFSAKLFDREIIFIAPDINKILALSEQVKAQTHKSINICIVPKRALRAAIIKSNQPKLIDEARQRLARHWPYASAHLDLTIPARLIFLFSLILIIAAVILPPPSFTPILLPLLIVLFLLPAWFRIAALFELFYTEKKPNTNMLDDIHLPIYSILIPLRDEAQMVEQLTKAMQALDYPPEKLDIKFIVEQASPKTVKAIENTLQENPNFELVVVPPYAPHTKPKALDYALPMVRGEYLVIYDAEDIPQKDQLRLAATRFYNEPSIDCVQAELVIDNAKESWLTTLFAAEYSGLFGVMLPALARWNFPMPLGGTSNHFRVQSLYEVGGWDAFNVTEDADLGVRLSRLRYKTGTLASYTYEEAPVSLSAWMAQRTRWMKGWMQTFIVHNRFAKQFLRDAGWKNFLAFQIYVGSLIISAPLHTLFLIAIIIRFITIGNFGFQQGDIWLFLQLFILVVGYIATISHSIAGVMRLKNQRLSLALFTLPIYWALSGIAAFLAAYELMVKPYFWAKTKHGISKKRKH